MIKKTIMIFTFCFILSCCSIKIRPTDTDTSLIFQQNENGQIWLSSMNSAQKINITNYKYEGDTLSIIYKRGLLCTINNVLPLKDNTKYLKCASKLYKVEKGAKGFEIEEIK